MSDVDRVIRIARATLGNPTKRAAKAARDAAIGRLAAAWERHESPETIRQRQAEADIAKSAYVTLLRHRH